MKKLTTDGMKTKTPEEIKEEKVMKVINRGINQTIGDVMTKYPNLNALEIINKVVFESIDKLAEQLNWSPDRKAKVMDKFFDNFNS
jgi:hypothetical protein